MFYCSGFQTMVPVPLVARGRHLVVQRGIWLQLKIVVVVEKWGCYIFDIVRPPPCVCLYIPVLGSSEDFWRTLIGWIVRFGVLRDMTTVRGLLGIWRWFSAETKTFISYEMNVKLTAKGNNTHKKKTSRKRQSLVLKYCLMNKVLKIQYVSWNLFMYSIYYLFHCFEDRMQISYNKAFILILFFFFFLSLLLLFYYYYYYSITSLTSSPALLEYFRSLLHCCAWSRKDQFFSGWDFYLGLSETARERGGERGRGWVRERGRETVTVRNISFAFNVLSTF